MKLPIASRWLMTLPAALACACGSSTSSKANMEMKVAGIVQSETGAPLGGVEVSLPALNSNTVSDGNGNFVVLAKGAKVGQNQAILLTHPAYSRLASNLAITGYTTNGNYQLRAYDQVTTITLPSADGETVSVNKAKDDGAVSLGIAAGDLVTAAGAVAAGQANVKLAYWHPNQSLASAPAPLEGAATSGGPTQALYSYGMASIEIEQDGALLSVAPNRKLSLDFNIPAAMAEMLTELDKDAPDAPLLWSADEKTGVWVEEGTLASGALTMDPNTKTISAKLPHLSAWNIDGRRYTNLCVRGRVVDNCNNPSVSAQLTMWVMSTNGQLIQMTINTATDGTFCQNMPGASDTRDGKVANFYAWVSNYQNPNQTVCNPTGKPTFSELCGSNTTGPECAGYDNFAPQTSKSQIASNPVPGWVNVAKSCGIRQVAANLCGYCAGSASSLAADKACRNNVNEYIGKMTEGACTDIGELRVPWCGQPPSNVDICLTDKGKGQADECTTTEECCPHGTLICDDGLCLPPKDPGSTN